MKTAIVINAGGTGTRLWPLSRLETPKQFLNLVSENSLLRDTYLRLNTEFDQNDLFIITNTEFEAITRKDIPELPEANLILEPLKMDRLAATGLITLVLKERGYDTVILIPCDDYIGNVEEFVRVLKVAAEVNHKNPENLLLIGMNPTYPSTGFGYIEMGEPTDRFGRDIAFKVQSFKEKPDQRSAEKFVSDWRYLWNASWYIFNPTYMCTLLEQFVPDTYQHLLNCYSLDPNSAAFKSEYSLCEKISFDFAISEKLEGVLVLPASVSWTDVGSWQSVRDIKTADGEKLNATEGNVITLDSEGCVVYSTDKKKLISVLGVKDLVVIDTGDTLLVTQINKSQDIKKLLELVPEELK